MGNVAEFRKEAYGSLPNGATSGSGGGDMSDLETRVTRIEGKIDNIYTHFATKADVMALNASFEKSLRLVIMWNVGTVIASTGIVATIVFAILRYGA
uniref:Haemolysin XhlA n=1 Tax=Candidatus Kentrum sp. FM TaxID=2126340 RepID=A0A450TBS2_9GAMM|nr:MAG: hypothetical protein BECKFM1743A_GA0114220_100722 [Candidatus Kentron sp. FM]VFJ64200.1 MAG: hypothetical protein BECKFM1743C_GA0114222_103622 [Candidatus Kentron sp. FM]VFK06073.1 MAG: hypothetical protein BECKFM1743B_GA0114221_100102 [Candidatus Kentron sp. FM]